MRGRHNPHAATAAVRAQVSGEPAGQRKRRLGARRRVGVVYPNYTIAPDVRLLWQLLLDLAPWVAAGLALLVAAAVIVDWALELSADRKADRGSRGTSRLRV